MSSIILLVGQCGNQVGHELMSLIDKSDTHPLSHRDGKLRCVCVDSEAKVINHNYREDMRSGRLYREGNMISGQRGRGNNWALGYHGLNGETEETSLLHRAMETVRKEVERCDNYTGKGLDYSTHCSCIKVKVFLQAYNLGQYKMEQLSPIPPPQSNDEGAKELKTRHFGIIEMGGGVVEMFHLFCPRLSAGGYQAQLADDYQILSRVQSN